MNIGAKIYAELRGDRVIWMILAVLSMFSILAVYSSTGTLAWKIGGGNTTAYLTKHLFILGLGLFLAYVAYLTPYIRFKMLAPFLWSIAFLLLAYTLMFGVEINDARRWIRVPFINLTFQTSDFAKMALILLVAREMTKHKDYIKDFNKAFIPIIIPTLLICGLIAPADLSTAAILFTTCLIMMFVGRVDLKYITLTIFLGIVVFAGLIVTAQLMPDLDVIRLDTWISRLDGFFNPPQGGGISQVDQAKIAIANGDIIGLGPGNSIQRNYLPTPYADFIYAIICEEYGLIGAFLILSLYVLLFFRTTRLVTISEKSFGAMAAVGLSLNIVIQALANMAIATNLTPVSGLTLPMVSWGGTSVLFTCLFFGIILSVSSNIEQATARGAVAEAVTGKSDNKEEKKQLDKEGQSKQGGSDQKKYDNRSGGQDRRYDNRNRQGGDRRGGGGYNRDNRNRGGNRDNRGGGYNRDNRNRGGGGGYNRDNRNRDNRYRDNRNRDGGNRNYDNRNRGGGNDRRDNRPPRN
ncbi:MAG: FtsW/RodA/SpoVE family cell cycle protein [Bacteroidota bacterium]